MSEYESCTENEAGGSQSATASKRNAQRKVKYVLCCKGVANTLPHLQPSVTPRLRLVRDVTDRMSILAQRDDGQILER